MALLADGVRSRWVLEIPTNHSVDGARTSDRMGSPPTEQVPLRSHVMSPPHSHLESLLFIPKKNTTSCIFHRKTADSACFTLAKKSAPSKPSDRNSLRLGALVVSSSKCTSGALVVKLLLQVFGRDGPSVGGESIHLGILGRTRGCKQQHVPPRCALW